MAPERHTQDSTSSRSRHSNRSRRDRDDASSVDSGYGGSAANSPKDTHDVQKDALRDYHTESAKHHAESGRRSSRSDESKAADSKAGGREERDSDSDSDYDPRDKYYLKVDDDEYNNMTSAAVDPAKDERERHVSDRDRRDDSDRRKPDTSEGHGSERRRARSNASERDRRERRDRRESDASSSSRRSERDRDRDRDRDRERDRHNSVIARRQSLTSDGSDSGERRNRRHSSSRHSDTSSTRSDSRDRKQLRRRSDASTASHSRHDSNHRSLSPIPSDSWDESDEPPRRLPDSRSSRARSEAGSGKRTSPDDNSKRASRSRGRDASARYIDPDGEAAKSFLDKITKGVDMKSVGKVGLDAAAVAAIKIAVGTQVPWKQRIPRTITVGAAAAIMDFVVKKTNFKPKGMIGTIYARQFVEIVLANLIVNPVSSRVTGAAQNAKGKAAAGKPGAGGGRR
ncbi:hypothetical protein KVR01_005781 [Diaporthe batatas]|uniref:uncharacterized protein n=1 Tax=Diaporthe batatas TaxID=748121 RepID=UPI001D054E04|nr:uncharacterized protein KVR01_005781 [Diaporthe batatas]KAG8163863.1 hypothetical protein KVR01_005781 [Diaporthe batatas]